MLACLCISILLHVCILTCAISPETRPLPAILRSHPCCRLIVQGRLMGAGDDFLAHHLGADRPLCFPGRARPVATSPSCFATFRARHRPLCRSMDGVPLFRNSVGDLPTIAPPLRPHRRSNSDHAGKSTYSGEVKSLDRDPVIPTLDPGMQFPRELMSLLACICVI